MSAMVSRGVLLLGLVVAGAAAHFRADITHMSLETSHAAEASSSSLAQRAASGMEQFWRFCLDPVEFDYPLMTSLVQTKQEPSSLPITIDQQLPQSEPPTMSEQLMGVVFQGLVVVAFAYLYIRYRRVPQGTYGRDSAQEMDGNWKHHCCSWYQEPGTALCAACCFSLRWAETMSLVKGVMRFWPALVFFAILVLFAETSVGFFAYLGMVVVGVSYRQELRRRFGFRSQGGSSYVTDCLMYMCCACCAVVQEARHVEDALARDHPETECPKDRQRSELRSQCLTTRFCTKEPPYYGCVHELLHRSNSNSTPRQP